eukprot:TRINITY_DN1568_c0_g1_i2.p2 TRINITY_DN1568_c0_g1~~TRINITY_DN1568_c0_g1_i2.p2  ORF type:complete len:116 (+),score=21.21 TRINITY_DN1568_c0_g1_i2:243-590(+)
MADGQDPRQPPAPTGSSTAPGTLAVARVKRVMTADPDVRMVAADAVACMTRAVELFIGELACAAAAHAAKEKKKTVQYAHVAVAAASEDSLRFLSGVLPDDKVRPRAKADFFRPS